MGNSLISRADAITNSIARAKNFQFFKILTITSNTPNSNFIGIANIAFIPSCVIFDVYSSEGQSNDNFITGIYASSYVQIMPVAQRLCMIMVSNTTITAISSSSGTSIEGLALQF